jgi:tight adherence protein B
MNNLLIGAAVLAVVAFIEGLYYAVSFVSERHDEDLRRRLRALGGRDEAGHSLLRPGRLALNPTLDALLGGVPALQRLATLIEQAQLGGTVASLLGMSLLAALAGAVVGLVLGAPLLAILLAVAGAAVPTMRLYVVRERRSRKLSQQLPNGLDMMARSLRAGHTLPGAFQLVATEMPAPINIEFARAYEAQNLGASFERAVLQMTARTPSNRDLRIFAVSVIIQKETGGNLVEILEQLAETIRSRFRFYGKLSVLAAEGRLAGIVLGALPVVTGLGLLALKPDYVTGLVTTPIGRIFFGYAIVTWLFGLLWLQRMGKVEL